jgi:ABC-type sugar transport system substrate-binding protein
MTLRRISMLSTLLVIILLLAACAAPAAAPAAPAEAPAAEAPAAESAATEAPAAEEPAAEGAVPAVMSLDEVTEMYGDVTASQPYKIGGIVKTLVNEHWQQVKAGYEAAAADLGVTVEIVAADSEADLAQQLDFAQTMIGQGVDALAVSPLSVTNLDPALEAAAADGIPIVNVDDARVSSVPTVFFGADHRAMGVLAAQYMIDNLEPGSQVAMVEGQAGSNAGIARMEGFHSTIEGSGLELVSSQPGDWDRVKALDAASNILQTNPDVKGIYAANDTMALGVIEAVGGSAADSGVMVIGTDAVPEAIQAIKDGRLTATIAAFPYQLGYNGLVLAVRALEGQALPAEVQAPMELIIQDNVLEFYPE